MNRILCLASASIVAGGCYNYQAVALAPTPESGTYVVATLTDSGARALSQYLGPEARAVRGRSLGSIDAGLVLSVAAIETSRGDELTWAGERATLPLPFIAAMQSRRLAKGRSAMLVGLGVAAVIGTAAGFSLLGSGGTAGQGGGLPHPH